MNKTVWDRVAEAANQQETIDVAELASALMELRAAVASLKADYARCQDSLHHIDKHLGKIASACKVSYGRVTADLVGE